ncbi:hypothetical protein FBU59_001143 [Linderina macrospora]|uniref:Uncharacterized protein n=1 Tax=Linderina macrospora TaxID=4868 RepID=A0ACC1JEW0_9FUNG|nr:hypothetical protein FBU59_001143 [Linderina macrospora]
MADQCPTDNVAMKLSVDMHVSAVQAAVAMKNPKLVRSVYNQAIRYMRESPNTRPSGIASLRRFFAALVYPSVVAEELSSGTDRKWDAARLGPAFLMQTFEDAKSIMPGMEATRCLMLQYALRAMVQTGQWTRALRIYQAVQWNHAKTGPKPTTHVDVSGVILTSAITTEMVRGLGRNSQMDEARRILMDAPQNIRSVYMWNAFLSAVVDQIGAVYSPNNGSRYDLEYLDLQLHCMKKVHGIQPDHTTETIRMRALLRSGEWKRAVKCFRRIQRAAPEDIVAWDTLVRGLMMADDRAANNCGWEMVDELVQNALPDMADARMADTVLKFALPMVASSFCERNPESMARILQWAEKRMGKDRKSTYAIVVGALLRAGQVDSALEIHRTMRARGFWPSRAISCMIAEELAKKDSGRAEAFIETQVSPHYFASAYSAVLKAVLVTRDYEAAWRLMDAHYPVVQLPEDHGQMPFPDSIMYHRALQMARTHGDWEELRRVLSRMRHHLELSRDEFPQFATRIAQLLHNYKYAGTSPCGHT